MEIITNGDMIHVTSKGFEFNGIGDVYCADSIGARYERVGCFSFFTFGNFKGSRRLFRVLCKKLTKQNEE